MTKLKNTNLVFDLRSETNEGKVKTVLSCIEQALGRSPRFKSHVISKAGGEYRVFKWLDVTLNQAEDLPDSFPRGKIKHEWLSGTSGKKSPVTVQVKIPPETLLRVATAKSPVDSERALYVKFVCDQAARVLEKKFGWPVHMSKTISARNLPKPWSVHGLPDVGVKTTFKIGSVSFRLYIDAPRKGKRVLFYSLVNQGEIRYTAKS